MMRYIAGALLGITIMGFIVVVGLMMFLISNNPALQGVQLTLTMRAITTIPTLVAQVSEEPTEEATPSPAPSETNTLLPPPTFEPPTSTPPPSPTPSPSPTATFFIQVDIPGLNGAESPTPSSTPGCEINADWQLTYEIQANDALASIAERYGLYVSELAAGNCLENPDVISIGQVIHVPGDAHPSNEVVYDCSWEVLTPIQYAYDIPGEGTLTFNWIGPESYRNLIRIVAPDGDVEEYLVDKRQNETIDIYEELWLSGSYTWYVYPLDEYFQQIPCPEGGPWTFHKGDSPTPTPTLTPTDDPDD